MHPLDHAKSSVERWGGEVSDYLHIHEWFDVSKSHFADVRHRALRHHSQGIFECEHEFGVFIVNSEQKQIPVRFIGEQHVKEDLGRIPSIQDWFQAIHPEPWMRGQKKIAISETVECVDASTKTK